MWPGETAYILCGGPSLAGFDFDRLKERRVIAINSSVFSAPFAEVCFFGDARWWGWNHKQLAREYKGLVVSSSEIDAPGIHRLQKKIPPPAITDNRNALTVRNTSLTGAINLAVHFGCNRIVLLGADMRADTDGKTHHHTPHPIRQVVGCWDRQMTELKGTIKPLADKGVEVINTSLDSRLTWWPKRSIDEVLDGH
jgi:hypothetical protein